MPAGARLGAGCLCPAGVQWAHMLLWRSCLAHLHSCLPLMHRHVAAHSRPERAFPAHLDGVQEVLKRSRSPAQQWKSVTSGQLFFPSGQALSMAHILPASGCCEVVHGQACVSHYGLLEDDPLTLMVMALRCASTSRDVWQAGNNLSTLKYMRALAMSAFLAESVRRPLRRSVVPLVSLMLTANTSPCASSLHGSPCQLPAGDCAEQTNCKACVMQQ